MRIRGPNSVQTPGNTQTPAGQSTSGSFRSLLQQRLSALSENEGMPDHGERPGSWSMIEDIAQLLDEALSSLEAGNAPEPELMQNLHDLRKQLHRLLPEDSEGLTDLDTLITVEARRLERW